MKDREAGTPGHRASAASLVVRCAIIVVSDSRTTRTDESGPLARRLIETAGHTVVHSELMPNGEAEVRAAVAAVLERDDIDAIILSGGTGLGSRDRTVEAIRPLLERELPGFGELFRWISFRDQIGTASILSRALAGTARQKLVVSLPGSKAAVELALDQVLLPELRHVIHEMRR